MKRNADYRYLVKDADPIKNKKYDEFSIAQALYIK